MILVLRGAFKNGFSAFLDDTFYELIVEYTNTGKYIELFDCFNLANKYSFSNIEYNET